MRSMEGAYYPRLDHIRAIAAFQVYFWHFVHFWVPASYVPGFFLMSLLEEGHTGVALFMTLSGYLFAKLTNGKTISYPAFLWNRLVRLAPLLAVLFLYYAYFYGFGWADLLRGFVFPTGWPSGAWSIAVELHFYIVFPLLVGLRRRLGPGALLACLVLSLSFRAVIWWNTGEVQVAAYWTLIGRLDQFVLGMVFFHLSASALVRQHATLLFLGALLVFGAFWHLFDRLGGYLFMPSYPSPSALWIAIPTIEGLAYGALIASYENLRFELPRRLSAVLAHVGEVSYSLYLLHFLLILEVLKPRIAAPSGFWEATAWALLCFPMVVLVASVSYHLIERPFLGLRRRYVRSDSAAGAAVAA